MNFVPQPDPQVYATPLANGEVVLLHLETRQYYSMNTTGALLWRMMQQSLSIDGLIQALLDQFGLSPEFARRTVCEFVQELKALRLITIPESRTQTP